MELQIKELDVNLIAPNVETMNKPEQGGSKIVIIGKPGCFSPGTRVRLYSGKIKTVETMTRNDVVMGWDHQPRFLCNLCQGRETMYRISYGKQRTVVVNERHILTLWDKKTQRVRDIPLWELIGKQMDHHFFWMVRTRTGDIKKISFSITRVGWGPYFGFTLVGPDHHFLLADGSIVHNTGKCLGKNTKILLYDFSIKLVQDIQTGDVLFGDDGQPRRVLSTTSGKDRLYRIHQSQGEDYIVNSEHILCLQSFSRTTKQSFFRTIILEVRASEVFEEKTQLLKKYGGYQWLGFYRSDLINTDPEFLRRIQRPFFREADGSCTPYVFREQTLVPVYPIDISIEEEDGEYFGFEIDGNGRFCLADGTITHNTTLITSLLYEKRHIFPVAFIMSGTEDSNGHYKRIVPSTFVYNKLQEKKIEDFVMRQKIAKKHLANPWAVLLLDDCTDDPKLFNKPLFQGLYKNGRHWKMWFILSLQYCMDIKPVIRTNVDGVFILRETNLRNRRSLWENYAGIIPDFTMFCSIMDQITDNYTALYIHNATTSNSLEDCLYWYKAKHVPETFRFGSKDLWKFHYNRYDDRYSDPFV